jgi:hypothetical protein
MKSGSESQNHKISIDIRIEDCGEEIYAANWGYR